MMPGKKAARIAELEAEVARITGLYDAERFKVRTRDERIARLTARKVSLGDVAKREFHAKLDWLLEAVGL